MPKITIEWSAEEKAEMNREGQDRGSLSCPECGDHMNWKPFHETIYAEGELTFLNRARAMGKVGLFVLCQECWEKLTPEAREQRYLERLQKDLDAIKPVARRMTHTGELQDDAKDAKRHLAERLSLEDRHREILQALRKDK